MDIRRAGVEDWEVVREVRLRALADAPDAFGSDHEREAAFARSVWLATPTNATLICQAGTTACGMVTIVQDAAYPGLAWLVGMWVAPEARRAGVGQRLIDEGLRAAGALGYTTVRLHVVDGNAAAERLYQRHGFLRTGRSMVRDRDGTTLRRDGAIRPPGRNGYQPWRGTSPSESP